MFYLSKLMLAFVRVDFSFFIEPFQTVQHFRNAQKFLDIMACLERTPYFSLCQDLEWMQEFPGPAVAVRNESEVLQSAVTLGPGALVCNLQPA